MTLSFTFAVGSCLPSFYQLAFYGTNFFSERSFSFVYPNFMADDSVLLAVAGADRKIVLHELFLILLLLFVAAIGYLLWGYFRYRALYNKEREDKLLLKEGLLKEVSQLRNVEVSLKMLELEKRLKMAEKVKTKLTRIKEKLPEEYQGLMNATITEVGRCESADLWTEFEVAFVKANPHFFQNIQSRFPDLTSNELKICAMIKVNITSKDISGITNLSIKSIEAIRTKLRKKFNLGSTDMLLGDFLDKF